MVVSVVEDSSRLRQILDRNIMGREDKEGRFDKHHRIKFTMLMRKLKLDAPSFIYSKV